MIHTVSPGSAFFVGRPSWEPEDYVFLWGAPGHGDPRTMYARVGRIVKDEFVIVLAVHDNGWAFVLGRSSHGWVDPLHIDGFVKAGRMHGPP